MSDVLEQIRRELQQRLDSTRAAAQEHERVRAALDALEHAVRPLEKVTRQAAGTASRRKRSPAGRARAAKTKEGSARGGSDTTAGRSGRSSDRSARRGMGSPQRTGGGRKAAAASTAKAGAAAKTPARASARTKPARARAPRGANREAVLAVVRERPGVTANELAAASGVTGGTLYSLLGRLTDQGEIAKRELPSGQTGYAAASGARAEAGPRRAAAETTEGVPTTSERAATEAVPAKPDAHDPTPSQN